MGYIKEKSGYRPTRVEVALGVIFTAAAGLVVAWWLYGEWFARG